jgi:hypothetical protein
VQVQRNLYQQKWIPTWNRTEINTTKPQETQLGWLWLELLILLKLMVQLMCLTLSLVTVWEQPDSILTRRDYNTLDDGRDGVDEAVERAQRYYDIHKDEFE